MSKQINTVKNPDGTTSAYQEEYFQSRFPLEQVGPNTGEMWPDQYYDLLD